MFEQTFVADGKTKRERTIAFALILQALGVTGLALLPLINAERIDAGKRFVLLPPAKSRPEPPELKRASVSVRTPPPCGLSSWSPCLDRSSRPLISIPSMLATHPRSQPASPRIQQSPEAFSSGSPMRTRSRHPRSHRRSRIPNPSTRRYVSPANLRSRNWCPDRSPRIHGWPFPPVSKERYGSKPLSAAKVASKTCTS